MKLWLDDLRQPPEGWKWATGTEEAMHLLESENISEASLDHDLGEGEGHEGYDLLLWMAKRGIWPSEAIAVHSSNPPGAERMCAVIERYGPYRRLPASRSFVRSVDGVRAMEEG